MLTLTSQPMGELSTFLASLFGPYEMFELVLPGGWRREFDIMVW